MRHEAKVILHDLLTAARRIESVMSDVPEPDFVDDWKLRSIVERQYMVLGEALGRLRKDHPALASTIGSLDEVIDFRNVLAHAYDRVDPRLVYSLTRTRLGTLRVDIERAAADAS
jgi:uncharacterized protein with HEPN domain